MGEEGALDPRKGDWNPSNRQTLTAEAAHTCAVFMVCKTMGNESEGWPET